MKGKYIIHGPGVDVELDVDGEQHFLIPAIVQGIRRHFMAKDIEWKMEPFGELVATYDAEYCTPYPVTVGTLADARYLVRMKMTVFSVAASLLGSRVRTTMSVMFRKRIPAKAIEAGETEGEFWL